ncbi:hypothetical protein JI75_06695 [Berryella intestinalis]|uniref:HTH gntR-type domain-containing protein n=1 Tax=Berryella intestinalis TaxID=1531429 RepID=A0A0A8B4Q1_9ACTN|nr:PLP-dependent aminotransferase family protein [Berryella intestinalis]AJC12390.1 hypothetical protein JI75_06695 [Berryella intestinalis]
MLTYDLNECPEKQPLYEFLYERIRDDIVDGRLAPGDRLPGKRSLANHLGASANTVMRAYDMLLAEGFLYARERRGYFVEEVNYAPKPRAKARLLPDEAPVRPKAAEARIDTGGTRASLDLFPASIWGRCMREALSLPTDELMQAIPHQGLSDLRSALCDYLYRNRGIEASPNQVVVGPGTEVLFDQLLVLLGRQSKFAFEDPGYRKLETIADLRGVSWERVRSDEGCLRVDELGRTGASFVRVAPANLFPQGRVMPVKRRIELFEWANAEPGRYIVEDDYDSEFRYGSKPFSPLFAEDVNDRVVYMNTFSKTLAPSLRIGYMILPPGLLERYESSIALFSSAVSSFEQYALARFIEKGHFERQVYRLRNHYRKTRNLVATALASSDLAGILDIERCDAGTHLLMNVRTRLSNDEARARGARAGMRLAFLEDYTDLQEPSDPGTCRLVLNYAGITEGNLNDVVGALRAAFL